MANNLIPEELNALIQQYLTDGVLTDKERQVILNKAEKMGLDRDEIDLYLDAEVQKIDQQTDAVVRKQKGKTCPYCGGSVPQLTDKCPHCGENITPEASAELQEILDNLEEALVEMKAGKDVDRNRAIAERYARKAKLYYNNNPKIQKLLAEIENEIITTEKVIANEERKETLARFLKNPWAWLLIEIVVFGSLLCLFVFQSESADQKRDDIYAKMVVHPEHKKYEYKRFPDEETSPEYAQLMIERNKETATMENAGNHGLQVLFFGGIAIIITVAIGFSTIKKE